MKKLSRLGIGVFVGLSACAPPDDRGGTPEAASTVPAPEPSEAAGTVQSSLTAAKSSTPLDKRAAESFRKAPIAGAQIVGAYTNRIAVKFREGSGTRPLAGALSVRKNAAAPASPQALAGVTAALAGAGRHAFVRVHDQVSEDELDAQREAGQQQSGRELADLNLWTYLFVDVASADELAKVINRLNALDIVEVAEPSYLGELPSLERAADGSLKSPPLRTERAPWPDVAKLDRDFAALSAAPPPPPAVPGSALAAPALALAAPNFEAQQVYKGPAPVGVDTNWLQSNYWNSAGVNWTYADIEYEWNQSHTDLIKLSSVTPLYGQETVNNSLNKNHGTAVIGQLSSTANGTGTTGMIPSAGVRLAAAMNNGFYNLAGAITATSNALFPGAVMLIEQQAFAGFDCNGSDTREAYVPSENAAAVRDAIRTATANGRIVVEAAGNGNCDLDQAGFNGRFATTAAQDSGAIIVGAGDRDTRNRAAFSCYGARVDVHAEGDSKIVTTGYGNLYSAEGENSWFTNTFGGTSGASPIITGAVVSLSSLINFTAGSYYNPYEIRDLLRRDGTPQGTGGNIGKRPDLRKQISHMYARHNQHRSSDFDGDGRTDYAVWRPSNGTWYIRFSSTGTTQAIQWGALGDVPVSADVIGDARAELIVWRPSSGTWWVRNWDGSTWSVAWGQKGDVPVPIDWDGDGKAQFAVYRTQTLQGGATSRWYILRQDRLSSFVVDFGDWRDAPMAGDFNGDGRDDIAHFRSYTGTWLFVYSNTFTSSSTAWGAAGDVPLTFRANGRHNIAVWRPGNQHFYSKNLATGATADVWWGEPGDIPRFVDIDVNGVGEYLIWRPKTGTWWNQTWGNVQWGLVGDIPIGR